MGLIKNAGEEKYAVLSDILGDEDHLGDMDSLRLRKNHKAVILRQNVKHVPRQKQSVVKTAEAVTTVIVTEINKGTIKVNVRIMIVATKMEMVKATVIMGTAVTIVIVTVISKVNSAMIKVEINVTMLPATIRQVHVLTLKRVQQP